MKNVFLIQQTATHDNWIWLSFSVSEIITKLISHNSKDEPALRWPVNYDPATVILDLRN